jgi:hypothetical protein
MAALLDEEVEAHGAGFRAFGADAVADRLFGILRHKALELGLGLFVFEMIKIPANSAQALEPLISTIRTASMRGLGGSTPNRRGGSPLSTQCENFRSAVTTRC